MSNLPSLQHLRFACIRTIVNASLYVRSSPWLSPDTQPDRVKIYGERTDLFPSRIFMPRILAQEERLPLVIRAHGGGFIVNNPAADDALARHLADHCRCVVVSIDYRKAPQNKFPRAYEDVVEQSLAAIDDPDLQVDHKRIVLCGSSAGGNLLLAAAQDARLRDRVTGVVALYALCDLVPSGEEKMSTRPDPSVPDFLGDSYSSVRSLYLDDREDVSLTDPRLSPTNFASRDDLPLNILLIGSEHDMLCYELETMANRLAAASNAAKVETEAGWVAGGVQWHKVQGQPHAFEQFAAKAPEKEKARLAARDATYSLISEWLRNLFSNEGDKLLKDGDNAIT